MAPVDHSSRGSFPRLRVRFVHHVHPQRVYAHVREQRQVSIVDGPELFRKEIEGLRCRRLVPATRKRRAVLVKSAASAPLPPPVAPAPTSAPVEIVEEEPPSLLARIGSWFSQSFGGNSTALVKVDTPAPAEVVGALPADVAEKDQQAPQ